MNRSIAAVVALALALPVLAQEGAKSQSVAVASVNGEVITKARLDEIWSRVPEHLQKQYESVGGRTALLNNYLRKRLLLQHAFKTGFAKPAEGELDVARESELFNRYVREVIAPVVLDEEVLQAFYQENRASFRHPAQVKLRHIFVSTKNRSQAEAREKLALAMNELHQERVAEASNAGGTIDRFAKVARRHSEEEASAANGGLVGWIAIDKLDSGVGDAARSIPAGTVSGVLASTGGVHLILVEDRRDAGVEPFEAVADAIREHLFPKYMNQIMEVVNARTTELLATSQLKIYAENIE